MSKLYVPVFSKKGGEEIGTAVIESDGRIGIKVSFTVAEEIVTLHEYGFAKGITLGIVAEEAMPRRDVSQCVSGSFTHQERTYPTRLGGWTT